MKFIDKVRADSEIASTSDYSVSSDELLIRESQKWFEDYYAKNTATDEIVFAAYAGYAGAVLSIPVSIYAFETNPIFGVFGFSAISIATAIYSWRKAAEWEKTSSSENLSSFEAELPELYSRAAKRAANRRIFKATPRQIKRLRARVLRLNSKPKLLLQSRASRGLDGADSLEQRPLRMESLRKELEAKELESSLAPSVEPPNSRSAEHGA